MPDPETPAHVLDWLHRCLPETGSTPCSARKIRTGPEREVWDCAFGEDGRASAAILLVFKPGSLESVNTSLPPARAARKCALAMTELPALGIPAPRLLGQSAEAGQAAVLCEKIERAEWTPAVRFAAARVLARVHSLQASELSEALRELVEDSDPRERRTTGGEAPAPKTRTMVHGDYFSANILPSAAGLRVIDWETFAWGDPMWDLAFLVGADRNVPAEEAERAIAAYAEHAPVYAGQLDWHRRRWSAFWSNRRRKP